MGKLYIAIFRQVITLPSFLEGIELALFLSHTLFPAETAFCCNFLLRTNGKGTKVRRPTYEFVLYVRTRA